MSTYVCIFENGWKTSKIFLEFFRHFKVTMYISKQFTASYLFQQSLFSQWTFVRIWFSQVFFDTRCRLIEIPSFTFPHSSNNLSFSLMYCFLFWSISLFLLPRLIYSSIREDPASWHGQNWYRQPIASNTVLQCEQKPSTLKQSIFFWVPVV